MTGCATVNLPSMILQELGRRPLYAYEVKTGRMDHSMEFQAPLIPRLSSAIKSSPFLIDASGEVLISHIINITSDYHLQLDKIIVGKVLGSKGHLLQEDYEKWEHSCAPSLRLG